MALSIGLFGTTDPWVVLWRLMGVGNLPRSISSKRGEGVGQRTGDIATLLLLCKRARCRLLAAGETGTRDVGMGGVSHLNGS